MSPSTRWFAWIGGALLLAMVGARFGAGASLDPPDVVPVGRFSEMEPWRTIPEGWKPVSLAAAYNETTYRLVRSDRGVVIRARSEGSSSVLGTNCHVDLTKHPVLEWHWKVADVVTGANVNTLDQNDAPARLIITFDYDDELTLTHRLKVVALRALGYDVVPRRALVYLWANRPQPDTIAQNPFFPWMRQVPVRSGTAHVGKWVAERRNVFDDYKAAFGGDPPPVKRVGLMTDANNTTDLVTAYYGDIVFRSAPSDSAVVDTALQRTNGDPEHQ